MRTYAFLASLFASGALGQSALADCFRSGSPEWKDCDTLWDKMGFTAGNPREITRNCGRDTDIGSECYVFYEGACQIAQCLLGDSCVGTSEGRIFTSKTLLESQCRSGDLGGRITEDPGYFEIIRYTGVPASRRRRSLSFGKKTMSLAEYEKTFGEDRDVVISKTFTDNMKRQSGDWINLVTYDGVIKPGERWRVNTEELAPGIERTWEESSSHSITVGVTAGVSAGLFEIFTASMEISTSYEETYSVASSLKYSNGDCPSGANIYYAPVYTRYGGIWSDEPDVNVDIWVPRQVNGVLEGRWILECVGSSPP
ncbi:hypothetical protein DER45DRAFT_620022 [Fusarium avenaceum]|nr:hypothetical protein DER45DRAFT_620022 [Fusarium avenaceum]